MQKARIKLASTDINKINEVCSYIKDISEKTGVEMRGPIPLPTKRLKVTTRKSPDGEGTATWEHYEMRIHKRLVDILEPSQKTVEELMKLDLPAGVDIEIKM